MPFSSVGPEEIDAARAPTTHGNDEIAIWDGTNTQNLQATPNAKIDPVTGNLTMLGHLAGSSLVLPFSVSAPNADTPGYVQVYAKTGTTDLTLRTPDGTEYALGPGGGSDHGGAGLQGGQVGEYYHLTSAEYASLQAGSGHGSGTVTEHSDVSFVGAAEGLALVFDANLDLVPGTALVVDHADLGNILGSGEYHLSLAQYNKVLNGYASIDLDNDTQLNAGAGTLRDALNALYSAGAESVFDTGTDGLVPGPTAGELTYFLRGDKTWFDVSSLVAHGTGSVGEHGDVDLITDPPGEGELLFWRTDKLVPEPLSPLTLDDGGTAGTAPLTVAKTAWTGDPATTPPPLRVNVHQLYYGIYIESTLNNDILAISPDTITSLGGSGALTFKGRDFSGVSEKGGAAIIAGGAGGGATSNGGDVFVHGGSTADSDEGDLYFGYLPDTVTARGRNIIYSRGLRVAQEASHPPPPAGTTRYYSDSADLGRPKARANSVSGPLYLMVTEDQAAALDAATAGPNPPTAGNRIATQADVAAGGGGDVSAVPTPVNGEIAAWTGSNTIQGIATVPYANLPVGTTINTVAAGNDPRFGTGGVDTSGTPVQFDFARFTDADTIEGRDPGEVRADLSLVPGTDVQAFSAVLQATTASYTTEEAGKLAAIEAGAVAAGALGDAFSGNHAASGTAHDAVDIVFDPTTSNVANINIDLQAALEWIDSNKEATANKGQPNGYASLDGTGKVPASQLTISGGMNFLGAWDANTNSPALSNGSGASGDIYIVSAAGTTLLDGISDWGIGDWVVSDGTAWQKIDNTDTVGATGDAYASSHEANPAAHDASEIVNAASGGIAAVTVQGAINELDSDKLAASDTRIPTQDEKDAMTNAPTAPTAVNPFVTSAEAVTASLALPVDEIVVGDVAAKGVKTSGVAVTEIASNTSAISSHLGGGNPHSVTSSEVGLGNVLNVAQIPASEKGVALGVAELDAQGKLPTTQLPIEAMSYLGGWDASGPAGQGNPNLNVASYSGDTGDVFIVSVAGTLDLGGADGSTAYALNDKLIWNAAGNDWDHIPVGAGGAPHTHPLSDISPFTKAALDGKIEHVLYSTGPNEFGIAPQQNTPIPATARIAIEIDNASTFEKRYVEVQDLVVVADPLVGTTRSITLQAPTGFEDITMMYVDTEIEVSAVHVIARGTSPNVNWFLRYGDRTDAGTIIANTSIVGVGSEEFVDVTGLSVTIPPGSWIWITTSSASNIDELSVSFVFDATAAQGSDPNAVHTDTNGDISGLQASAPKAALADGDTFILNDSEAGNAPKGTRLVDIQSSLDHDSLGGFNIDAHRETIEDTTANLGSYPAASHPGKDFFGTNDLVRRRAVGANWLIVGVPVDDTGIEIAGVVGSEVIQLKDDGITLAKLAPGTPGKWIKFNDTTGQPEEADAPLGGGGGAVGVATFVYSSALSTPSINGFASSDGVGQQSVKTSVTTLSFSDTPTSPDDEFWFLRLAERLAVGDIIQLRQVSDPMAEAAQYVITGPLVKIGVRCEIPVTASAGAGYDHPAGSSFLNGEEYSVTVHPSSRTNNDLAGASASVAAATYGLVSGTLITGWDTDGKYLVTFNTDVSCTAAGAECVVGIGHTAGVAIANTERRSKLATANDVSPLTISCVIDMTGQTILAVIAKVTTGTANFGQWSFTMVPYKG